MKGIYKMKLGFIGCSNITKAMMRCIIDSKFVDVKDIYATNKDKYELANSYLKSIINKRNDK